MDCKRRIACLLLLACAATARAEVRDASGLVYVATDAPTDSVTVGQRFPVRYRLTAPDSLAFVADQIGHPSFCADLAPVLRRLAVDRRSGVHHVTNQGAVSWFEFAQEVVAAMGKPRGMVAPITTAELQPARPATRPANSVLDNVVLLSAGIPLPPDFRESLQKLVSRLTS